MSALAPDILGLDVGARQIGVAVLRGEELVFYAVKSIKQNSKTGTLARLEQILTALIEKYDIEAIAIKQLVCVQQLRSFAKTVYEAVKNFALGKNIRLFECQSTAVRRVVCQGAAKPTKRNTALLLSQRYTELTRYFNVRRLWQKRYYAQLFDAIAVGLVCAKEIRETILFSAQSSGEK